MTLAISLSSMHPASYQKLFETHKLLTASITQGAPLAQILIGIASGIETLYPDLQIAIFLPDEQSNQLRLAAAPKLKQEYRQALDLLAMDAEIWAQQLESNPADAHFRTADYSRSFVDMAARHGLHASAAMPVQSDTMGMLGVVIAYTTEPEPANDHHRQAVANFMPLAILASERQLAQVRIKKIEKLLFEGYARMSLAIDGSGTGIWDRNISTGEMHYSTGWKALFGYAEEEISNRIEDSYLRVHPDDLTGVQSTIQAHFERRSETYAVEHRIRCRDGSYKWASSRGKVVSRDSQGNALRMIGTTTDVTAMHELSDRLKQGMDLLTSLTNEVPGLVYQYRRSARGESLFSYVSEGIRDIYELTPEQVTADCGLIDALIHPDDLAGYTASIDASAISLRPWHLEYRVVLPRQGLRWRQGDARPRRMADGSTLWHGFITDVTERKTIEMELQEFATIDFLTRLPNRRHFMACMENELARIKRDEETRAAVLMCDLDHFKIINDRFGHATGDLVLKNFANILQEALRKSDTVGRIGGEEFAVVLSGAGLEEATSFARRVQDCLSKTPLVQGAEIIAVTVSIGITVMQVSDDNAGASLSRSDMALYRAKELGRNRIETHGA